MTATSVKSPPDAGDERLNGLYDRLRERLLDLSNRNPMLNTRLSGLRSRRFVQIVDDAPEDIYRRLIDGNGTGLDLLALSEPDRLPADERTEEFLSSLAHAKLADTEYLEAVAHLEREGRDDEASLAAAEEALRLKLRDDLGLPPRPGTTEMARADHARSLGIDPALDLPAAREAPHAAARGLQTLKYPDELEATLDRLSDDARLAAQETGLSTLYLALGFLERSESEASERLFLAPLLLLPVRLEERRLRGRLIYSIVPTAGAADTNLSLEKLVEQTEGRQLPAFGANDEDELAGIEAYFAAVAAAIDGLPRWKVRRFAVIGHFASGRFALYQDLSRENWRQPPTTHRLVRAILEGTDRPGAEVADLRPPEDYDIDAPEIETVVPHLVADADASQHSALIDAARGADLVIEGPPGTGKSQTIANLIAHAIGEGKRVLFLAEKQAALDVVKRRLDSAGLGDFCLELHSDKAVPKLVVAALKERAELDPKSVAAAALAGTDDVAHASSRAALSAYVADLHAPAEDGETPFRLIWRALAGYSAAPEECEALRPVLPSADWMGRGSQQAAVVHALDLYAHAAVEFARSHGPVGASPWAGTALADIPPFDLLRVRAALIQWREPLSQLAIVAGEGGDLGVRTLADLVGLTAAETELGVPPEADLVADMAAFELDAAEASLDCLVRFADCQARIAATPELAEAPRRVTARAAELMASRLGPALGDRIPADLSSVTRRRIAEAEELIEAVSGLEPAVALIGLDRDLGGEIYEAIAAVCRTLARLPSAGRVRLAAYARLDEAIVAEAKARLDDLSAAESDWRNLFPGFALADAPRSGEVRQTARWLARNGLSRVFSGLGADAGVARAVIRKLAIPAGADLRLLEQLADYLAFTEGFAADPAYLVAFGPAWAGIATPFAEITAAASLRRAFLAGLKAFAHGETVAAATLSSGPSGIGRLAEMAPAADRFLAVDASVRARLDSLPLGQAVPLIRAEIRAGAAILEMAEDAELARYGVPLKTIADVHRAREGLAAALAEAGRLPHVEEIAGILDGRPPEAALASVAYLRQLAASDLAVAAKINLAGRRAGELRALLSRLSAVTAEAMPRLREAAAASEAEFGAFNLAPGGEAGDGMAGLARAAPAEALARVDDLIAHHGQLGDFLALRRLKLDLAEWGLGAFVDVAERQAIAPDRLGPIFETLLAERRADLARRAKPSLASAGMALEARRQIFAEHDRAKILIDRAKLKARLMQARPPSGNNLGPKSGWTETALLRHEFAKAGRHLPIRALMQRAGRAIQALTPCFMMSPLSLAKFVAPDGPEFDLVVIDEASQMRPEDALGGLLRATQVVVVGDPKQLPPTDFFARMAVVDDESEDDDLAGESILEVCARSFGTLRRLKWHYRSRCESLIAFSNREFYEDKLVTFPNARPGAFSIDLVRVDGAYKAGRNVAEAARVAEEAVAFMRHAAELDDAALPSLGIVAVNRDQRDLIAEELRRLMHADPLTDRYRARLAAQGEPLFVKNLENVQGDERDYIFVSLTYGPAEGTKVVAQRFGPIAGRHGHRRLNVLFTRARQRIGLFASFGSADVHPSESSAAGVHVLKRYLAYVEERGRLAADSFGGEPDSDFEREVAARLGAAGFQVETQVGVAGYRLDLGVRHPDRPESFLAGIECDGARYHSARSARDRDRLREEVLKGLGWQILRVWSTDWFADPDEETRRLVRRLNLMRVLPDRIGTGYLLRLDLPLPGDPLNELANSPAEVIASERQLSLFDAAEVRPGEGGGEDAGPVDGAAASADEPAAGIAAIVAVGEADLVDGAPVRPETGEAAEEGAEPDAAEIWPGWQQSGAAAAELAAEVELAGEGDAADGFAEPPQVYQAAAQSVAPVGNRLDRAQLEAALIEFRETRIARSVANWERQRSILRDALIETIVAEHLDDPADWQAKVPAYQRLATNAVELRFLADICAIVARGA